MNEVVLLIGGNIGDRFYYLEKCTELIENQIGMLKKQSAIYETAAWGRLNQQDYLNQALLIETKLSPSEVLEQCEKIEGKLDRKREIHWGERTIDVDIIFYNRLIIQTKKLEIPHPRYHLRNFVLNPLSEIIPEFICPEFEESIQNLKLQCKDNLSTKKLNILNLTL